MESAFGRVLMCGTVVYDDRHEMVQNHHNILYYNHHFKEMDFQTQMKIKKTKSTN